VFVTLDCSGSFWCASKIILEMLLLSVSYSCLFDLIYYCYLYVCLPFASKLFCFQMWQGTKTIEVNLCFIMNMHPLTIMLFYLLTVANIFNS
jgi:hypothetical protein